MKWNRVLLNNKKKDKVERMKNHYHFTGGKPMVNAYVCVCYKHTEKQNSMEFDIIDKEIEWDK